MSVRIHAMQSYHSSLSSTNVNRTAFAGKTVLLADDDPAMLRILDVRCRSLGLRVETANDGLRTLLKVTKEKPDLLILDLNLPDVDGFRVVERLTDPKFPPLPVIVLTGRSDEEAIQRCEELGVLYVSKDGDGWKGLESIIAKVFLERPNSEDASAVREKEPPRKSPVVLLVDDDPVVLKSLAAALRKYDLDVIEAPSGMQGFWLTLRAQPDLVVTDYNMPHGSGHYLLSRIKSTPAVQHIPVIVFTGQSLEKGIQHAVRRDLRGRGQAAAFIAKPIDVPILLEQISRFVPLRGRP